MMKNSVCHEPAMHPARAPRLTVANLAAASAAFATLLLVGRDASPQAIPAAQSINQPYFSNFHANFVNRTITPAVTFLGDSITDHWGERPPLGNAGNSTYDKTKDGNSPAYDNSSNSFLPIWNTRISSLQATNATKAYNFGISGDRAENVLWRVQNGELSGPRRPKVVVLMIGTNNIGINANGPIYSTIQAILTAIAALTPQGGTPTRVLVMGVLPQSTIPSQYITPQQVSANNEQIAGLNAMLASASNLTTWGSSASRGYGSGNYFLDMTPYFAPGGVTNNALYEDYLHPTSPGYELWASLIAAPLRLMLGRVSIPDDFDGDGKSDYAVFQRSTGKWYVLLSASGQQLIYTFGSPTAIPCPADYDGDGLADIAVFEPNYARYNIQYSSTQTHPIAYGSLPTYPTSSSLAWGNTTVIPLPADYDGDGKADIAGFDQNYCNYAINYSAGGSTLYSWGDPTIVPVPADYDGDGKADVAGLDRSTGTYYISRSRAGYETFGYGNSSIVPAPEDNDGDGIDDVAGFDPAGPHFYDWRTRLGPIDFVWGNITSTPTPGDFDGDGLQDWVLNDNANGSWTTIFTTTGMQSTGYFGGAGSDWIPINATPFIRAILSRR